MADKRVEAVDGLPNRKVLRVGGDEWAVVEDYPVPVTCPDFFVDTRNINGNLHLALAVTRVEGGALEAVVCTRLRVDLVFAQLLRNALDDFIKGQTTATKQGKSNAN